MSWPLSQDYNEAIQSPATNFTDPDLKRGEAVANALGLPMPYSGNFADVYQVRCPDGGRWAVKCFTREALGLHERYQEISNHLKQAKLPFSVDCSYLDKGIRVGGQWYPVLKMQWVEGLTLNQFTAQYLDKPAMLEALLQLWAKMGKYLRAAEIGHCDLQHGNILLVPGSTPGALALKLIDYDGMWVPALAGKKSGEVGHPSYQHPQRLREGTYSLDVDRFPLLLVAAAMRAVKADKGLWAKYDNGDNMLFKETDLADPVHSELFQELASLPDAGLVMLAAHVRAALKGNLESAPLLEDAMPDAKGAPALASKRPSKLTGESSPTGGGPRSGTKVAPVVVAPVVAPPKEAKTFAFDESAPGKAASAPSRARLKSKLKPAKAASGGVSVAVWAGGGAAVLVLVLLGAVGAFFMTRGSGQATPVASGKPSDQGPATSQGVQAQPASSQPVKDNGAPGERNHPAPPKPEPEAGVAFVGTWKADHDDLSEIWSVKADKGDWTVSGVVLQNGQEIGYFKGEDIHYLNGLLVFTAKYGKRPPNWAETSKVTLSANGEGLTYSWNTGDGSGKHEMVRTTAQPTVATNPSDTPGKESIGEVRRFEGQPEAIASLDVSPDGKQVLTGGFDHTLRLLDVATGRELLKWTGPGNTNMHGGAFLPDGRRALSCGETDKSLHLWDLADAHEIRTFMPQGAGIWTFAVSPDGRFAASCGQESTVFIWDVETGMELRRLEGTVGGMYKVAFSPDAKTLLTGSGQGVIRLWEVSTGREIRRVGSHSKIVTGLAFLPDGPLAISTSADGTACIWNLKEGREVRRLGSIPDGAWSVALSADSLRAIIGAGNGAVILWDTSTGKELYRFAGQQGQVWNSAFSPDKLHGFTAGQDKLVHMWNLPPADYVPPPTADTTPVVKKPEPKPAAPDDASLAAAEKEVKDLYKAEYAKKKKEDVLALADKLRQQGVDTKDKPATRFVLFRESRDLAARAGDFGLSRRAVEEMVKDFAVNDQEMNVQAVEAAARAILAPAALVHIAEAGLPLAEEAVDADDYDMADRAIKAAGAAAHSASNSAMEKVTSARAAEIEALRKAWEPAGAAAQTLATKPDDPDASLALGAFFCLDKGDWGRGLPLLAQGSDKTLKALAQADLDAVADPAAQMELAKTYQGQADGEAGPRKAQFLRRACFWYQKAAAQFTGVTRAEADKKVGEIEKNLPPVRPAIVGAFYGTYNDWQDVTDKVRSLLFLAKGPKATVKADAAEFGVPNHDNHQGKTLAVLYQVGGQTCLSLTPEGGTATIPAAPGTADVDAARPALGQELLVLAARYGAEGGWADGALAAQYLVKGSSLTGASDALVQTDPAFGKNKALILVYRYGNRVRWHIGPHEETFVVGTAPAAP